MFAEILQFCILLAVYIFQISVPITSAGDTLSMYVLPVFIIIFRLLHFLRIMGLPINKSIPPFGELGLFGGSFLFMIINSYGKDYTWEIGNMTLTVLCTILVVMYEILNGILIHTVIVDENEVDKEGKLK